MGEWEARPLEELAELLLLGRALARVGKRGVDHAGNGRVRRIKALRRTLDDLDEARLDEMPLLLDDLGLDLFAGPGAGDEHDPAVAETAEPVAAVDVLRDGNGRGHFVNLTTKPPPFAMRNASVAPEPSPFTQQPNAPSVLTRFG